MKKRNRIKYLPYLLLVLMLFGCKSSKIEEKESVEMQVQEDSVSVVQQAEENLTEDQNAVNQIWDETGYYYEGLSAAEQTIYNQIYRALTERSEIQVDTLSVEVVDKVFLCVLNDHPELFYVSGYIYTSHSRGDEMVSLTVGGRFDYEADECERRTKLIEKKAEEILSGIPLEATDYDKVKYIFDTLVGQTEYVAGAVDNQNICSIFITNQSTCQGYAKATQYLLNKAGVETTFVSGEVAEGSHAWNLVKADGEWYYLDTTWGDVDYQSQRDEETVDERVLTINYDYFMIPSNRLYQTHTPNRIVALPDCIATRNNYYVHEGKYLSGLDTEVLHEIFSMAYANGETTVQFQCANDAVYEMVSSYLLDEQHIFDFVIAGDSVAYVDNPDTDTFCFWLE